MFKQDFYIPLENQNKILHGIFLKNSKQIDRILLLPPLVGGSSVQMYFKFRRFLMQERNILMFVFDYSGHTLANENSTFTIKDSIYETKEMVNYVIGLGEVIHVPVHIAGTCYSTIPISLAMEELNWPKQVTSFINFNGLVDIHSVLSVDKLLKFLNDENFAFNSSDDIFSFINGSKSINNLEKADSFKNGVRQYLIDLFPELQPITTSETFGELKYDRIDLSTSFNEFFNFPEIKIHPPDDFPVFFANGDEDDLLNFDDLDGKTDYLLGMKKLFPNGIIKEYATDHYGNSVGFSNAVDGGFDFLTKAEKGTAVN